MRIPRILLAAGASGSGKNADHLRAFAGTGKQKSYGGIF